MAEAVRAERGRLVYLDLTGALLGYQGGVPQCPPAAAQGWRTGVDPAALAAVVDGYACLGYVRDPQRLGTDVASVVAAVAGHAPVRVILRPGYPDTADAPALAEKVAVCRSLGVDAVDFYHYGMYPWPVLDRIPTALARPATVEEAGRPKKPE